MTPDRDTPWLPESVTLSDDDYEMLSRGFDNRLRKDADGRYRYPDREPSWLDPDPRVPDDSTPPRLPSDDGNPGTVIALVVLAAIVVLAVVGWWVAVKW